MSYDDFDHDSDTPEWARHMEQQIATLINTQEIILGVIPGYGTQAEDGSASTGIRGRANPESISLIK